MFNDISIGISMKILSSSYWSYAVVNLIKKNLLHPIKTVGGGLKSTYFDELCNHELESTVI